MSTQLGSWKLAVKPLLREVLRAEQRIVFGGVMISALFAVVMPSIPLLFMGVCILVVGNAIYALLFFGSRIYSHRPFPWNWILYIPMLAFGAFLSPFASVALLRWMHPSVGPYWQVFRGELEDRRGGVHGGGYCRIRGFTDSGEIAGQEQTFGASRRARNAATAAA